MKFYIFILLMCFLRITFSQEPTELYKLSYSFSETYINKPAELKFYVNDTLWSIKKTVNQDKNSRRDAKIRRRRRSSTRRRDGKQRQDKTSRHGVKHTPSSEDVKLRRQDKM